MLEYIKKDNLTEKMKYSVIYSDKKIEYILTRKNIKRLYLKVNSKSQVVVSAPYNISREKIELFIVSKAQFIQNAQEIIKNASYAIDYSDGAKIHIRGRQYLLSVCLGSENNVLLKDDVIILQVKNEDEALRKKVFDQWLALYSLEVFEDYVYTACSRLNIDKEEYPKVKVRAMTSLWGSYNTAKHTVTLNLRLIEAPEECIEYVALHEVCHIIYPDHGKNFHALMDKLLPHNKSIRKKLKESVILN